MPPPYELSSRVCCRIILQIHGKGIAAAGMRYGQAYRYYACPLAVAFATDSAAAVVTACNELGLLVNPVRPNAIRLMPPLIVTKEEIDEAIERLGTVLERLPLPPAAPA